MATLLYNAFHQVIRDTCSQVGIHTRAHLVSEACLGWLKQLPGGGIRIARLTAVNVMPVVRWQLHGQQLIFSPLMICLSCPSLL